MREVVPVEGQAFAAELVTFGDGRVSFRAVDEAGLPGAVRTMPLDELVRWGHPVEARPRSIVVLADGGRIVTAPDWAGGAAVRLEDDAVLVLTGLFEEVRVPRGLVRGVVFAQQSHPADRAALAEQVRTAEGADDAVLLTNQDRLSGELTELAGGSLTIATPAGAAKLPLSRVEAVVLGSRQSSVVSGQSKWAVGMRDGTLVHVNAIRADEDELAMALAGGSQLSGGSVNDIVALQSLGGRLVYLSDLEPVDYRHVPYLDIAWPWKRDRNVLGEPLLVGGNRYLKGLGMHSAARLTYRLDSEYARFDASVAIDDSARRRGSVTFSVYVLRDDRWQEAHTSDIIRGGDAPQPISVELRGATGLTLMVDYADRGDELDRANWLDARLIRK